MDLPKCRTCRGTGLTADNLGVCGACHGIGEREMTDEEKQQQTIALKKLSAQMNKAFGKLLRGVPLSKGDL